MSGFRSNQEIKSLALAAFQDATPLHPIPNDRMLVLADALEDAGLASSNRQVLHLRGWSYCGTCKGTGRREVMVDAGYNNPLMCREGWQHCYVCNGGGRGEFPGWCKPRTPLVHVCGCWALDLILEEQ